jgi:hypothetical protein
LVHLALRLLDFIDYFLRLRDRLVAVESSLTVWGSEKAVEDTEKVFVVLSRVSENVALDLTAVD